jgi:glutamate dehydrogenase (NAD(P)+)
MLGPYKGGIRYHDSVSLDDLKALAADDDVEVRADGHPVRRRQGRREVRPGRLQPRRGHAHHAALHARARQQHRPFEYDIPAPDVGTNAQTMVWMMDTYMNTLSHADKNALRAVVTGKTLACGGSAGREKATAQGVLHCITEWAREQRFELEGRTAIIQGFGNVGSHAGVLLAKLGVSIVGVGDHTGYLHSGEGFNVHKLQDHVRRNGSIASYDHGVRVTREDFFGIQADIFVPAALENQIGVGEANALRVRLVAEGANGPTHPAAEQILGERGIAILPDVLANSGGVTVSYFEWVQNRNSEKWDLEQVDAKLEARMKRAYGQVRYFSEQRHVGLRTAAYCLALQRLGTAYAERGIFP